MKETLLRLKNTARLEKMIEEGYEYEQILQQSQKLDNYITSEMKKRNGLSEADEKNSHKIWEFFLKLLTKRRKDIKIITDKHKIGTIK